MYKRQVWEAQGTGVKSARQVKISDAWDAGDTVVGKFLMAVTKLKRIMGTHFIPDEGRWLMVHPETLEGLDNYFTSKSASNIYTPTTSESTLRNGFAGMLYGFSLRVNTQNPSVQQTAANDSWQLYAGQGMESTTFANQLTETVAYNPELLFGSAIKGLMVYGVKCLLPSRLYTIQVKKAT